MLVTYYTGCIYSPCMALPVREGRLVSSCSCTTSICITTGSTDERTKNLNNLFSCPSLSSCSASGSTGTSTSNSVIYLKRFPPVLVPYIWLSIVAFSLAVADRLAAGTRDQECHPDAVGALDRGDADPPESPAPSVRLA